MAVDDSKSKGPIHPSDVARYCPLSMMPDQMAEQLNEIVYRRLTNDKIGQLADWTVEASKGSFPVVSLEIRIKEFVRGIVGNFLLSESEVRGLAESSLQAALREANMHDQIAKAVNEEIKSATRTAIDRALQSVFWDKDVQAALRKRIIKALENTDD